MMLKQIEERLDNLKKERETQLDKKKLKRGARSDGAKTVGVVVDPHTYAQLVRLSDSLGGVSLKQTVLAAAQRGLVAYGLR